MCIVIDSHIHIDQYSETELQRILERMKADQIERLIAVATNIESARKIQHLSTTYKVIEPAYGFHPEQAFPQENELDELFSFIEAHANEMVAIGEVGLPYYGRLNGDIDERDQGRYVELLKQWITLAKRYDKPLNLHAIYEDAATVCHYLERYSVKRAHFHWFKGDELIIDRLIANEYYVSITPDLLYKERTQQLVKRYPLEFMMVETDGPWPFVGPFQGKLTEPKMMHQTIAMIAKLKRLPEQEVYETIYETTRRLYRI